MPKSVKDLNEQQEKCRKQSKRLLEQIGENEQGPYCLIDKIMADIFDDIEYTRKRYHFNKKDFAEMIDFSRHRYYRLVKGGQRIMSLRSFLLFCGIFGLDVGSLLDHNYIQKENTAINELAVALSRMSNETIQKIAETVNQSSETDTLKKQTLKIISHLDEFPKKKPFSIKEVSPQLEQEFVPDYSEILKTGETRNKMIEAAVVDKQSQSINKLNIIDVNKK